MCGHSFRATHSLSSLNTLWGSGSRCLHGCYFCFQIVLSVYLQLGGGERSREVINEEMIRMSPQRAEESAFPHLSSSSVWVGTPHWLPRSGKQEGQVTTDHILCIGLQRRAILIGFCPLCGQCGQENQLFRPIESNFMHRDSKNRKQWVRMDEVWNNKPKEQKGFFKVCLLI